MAGFIDLSTWKLLLMPIFLPGMYSERSNLKFQNILDLQLYGIYLFDVNS
jgi:hypothetical protein